MTAQKTLADKKGFYPKRSEGSPCFMGLTYIELRFFTTLRMTNNPRNLCVFRNS